MSEFFGMLANSASSSNFPIFWKYYLRLRIKSISERCNFKLRSLIFSKEISINGRKRSDF